MDLDWCLADGTPARANIAQELLSPAKPVPVPGQHVQTPYGPGTLKKVLPNNRSVVNLGWRLADGKPARAYIGLALVE